MLEIIITAILSSGVASMILVFLAKTWIEARIKSSIEHEYRQQFELFSRELDRKEKIELVAELIAEYLQTPKGEKMERKQHLILNKLSCKASLWLPTDLAIELSKRLQNLPDAKSPFDLILLARKELLNESATKITGDHVTLWSKELEERGDPLIV